MKTENIIDLDNTTQKVFYSSLSKIKENLDFFVLRFYYYFLQTEAGALFHDTKFEFQYKMFYGSMELILNHITTPDLIENHLNRLVKKHKDVGVTVEHIDYFIGSFMKALQDVYIGENSEEIIAIWHKIIVKILTCFEKKLR